MPFGNWGVDYASFENLGAIPIAFVFHILLAAQLLSLAFFFSELEEHRIRVKGEDQQSSDHACFHE